MIVCELINNICPVELFASSFSSLETGIANAISCFKLRKIVSFVKKYAYFKWS